MNATKIPAPFELPPEPYSQNYFIAVEGKFHRYILKTTADSNLVHGVSDGPLDLPGYERCVGDTIIAIGVFKWSDMYVGQNIDMHTLKQPFDLRADEAYTIVYQANGQSAYDREYTIYQLGKKTIVEQHIGALTPPTEH